MDDLNELSGVRCISSATGMAGVYSGDMAYANTLGPSGRKVAYSDGSGIYASLLTAPFATLWAGAKAEGGMGCWIKADSGVWTDGVGYVILWVQVDANNTIYLTKAVDGNLYYSVNRGGVLALPALAAYKPTGWFHLFATWSEANNRVRGYLNGEQFYEAATGTWAGAPASALLYSLDTVTSWPGCIDTVAIMGGSEPTAAEVRALVNNAAHIARISVIGDSISRVIGDGTEWPWIVGYTHNSSLTTIMNHAEASMGIVAGAHNLAYQATAAANDDADAIIIALGTNDSADPGDQAAIQTALGAGIDALRLSNPRAMIHVVKVWPCYAADHSVIRASIAAVCTAKGVTLHDPTTPAVWDAGDSADGWHPNAAGHVKAATWVLGWL